MLIKRLLSLLGPQNYNLNSGGLLMSPWPTFGTLLRTFGLFLLDIAGQSLRLSCNSLVRQFTFHSGLTDPKNLNLNRTVSGGRTFSMCLG